ncbi:NYN domain-containing protein [Hathewaya limosa]|uniref:RNA-binding protein with PIN domain n=1 Tax=Hathewaya limosa TaxID=1536 RepID=A0ABU0JUZ4_HATLI|nr:NYN domain-containing protein [Hathewaya limosa]AWZ49554.1 RNA-binding protein [Clostridiaceae bacterium 14S0207]MDQ0480928.1 putative RNA-binding protein with PIN domain [Hathewaya limosa]
MKIVFVDGYNVINSWPNLASIKEHNFEGARQKLIDILQNYVSFKGYKVFLVFDAHMVKGALENKERIGDLIVVFTKYGETADSFIERSVNKIGRKSDVCVVTSDSLEQQLVFQRGATRKSSLEFFHEIQNMNHGITRRINSNYADGRNLIEDLVDKNILNTLDKMRRNG